MKKAAYMALMVPLSALLLGASGCEDAPQKRATPMDKEALIELNKKRASNEQDLLEAWVGEQGWDMKKTKTGLRYQVYASGAGDSAVVDNSVGITYSAYLLDQSPVAHTGADVHYFRVGHDDVISGLHEVVTLISRGDSVRVLIPSYLAYGLTGNAPSVPSNAPLYYDLCLVDIR